MAGDNVVEGAMVLNHLLVMSPALLGISARNAVRHMEEDPL